MLDQPNKTCNRCNVGTEQYVTFSSDGVNEVILCTSCCGDFISDRLIQDDERLHASLVNWLENQ